MAARFAAEAPDLKLLASEADVDRVVMGTLLRAGDQVRATAQLVEAPGGTLIAAHTIHSALGDLFRAAGRHRPPHRRRAGAAAGRRADLADAGRHPRATRFYRANEAARSTTG